MEIKLNELIGKKIFYREDISELNLKENDVLDFYGIDFLSISSAHEIINLVKKFKLKIKNMDKNIEYILLSQKENRKIDFNLKDYSLEDNCQDCRA